MNILLNRLIIALILLFSVAFSATADEKYKGIWSGGSRTSLEIVTETPLIVRYCFRGKCNLYEPNGTLRNIRINFPAGDAFPGAKLRFKKRGEQYLGTYKVKGALKTFRATLSK